MDIYSFFIVIHTHLSSDHMYLGGHYWGEASGYHSLGLLIDLRSSANMECLG